MRNILILTPFYPPNVGGAETFTEGLVKESSKCHNITVLTFQPFKKKSSPYEELSNSLRIYRLPWLIKQSGAWSGVSLKNMFSVIPQMAWKSVSLSLKNKYDIIHAQGLLSGLVAVLLKKLFPCKVYITLLALYGFSGQSSLFKNICKFIFSNCDVVFVEGANGKFDVAQVCDFRKIKQFSHWCDQNIFCPPETRSSNKINVLFVGRPIPEKGRHIIEEAERILNNPKYQFVYAENISYAVLPKLYQMAHIVVIPSLYPEGYSRVVIESASCGCALITSDKGSLPEMVRGWGIEINPTPQEFAYQIQKVHLDTAGKQAYDYAVKNFSPKNAEVFINEYSHR